MTVKVDHFIEWSVISWQLAVEVGVYTLLLRVLIFQSLVMRSVV